MSGSTLVSKYTGLVIQFDTLMPAPVRSISSGSVKLGVGSVVMALAIPSATVTPPLLPGIRIDPAPLSSGLSALGRLLKSLSRIW